MAKMLQFMKGSTLYEAEQEQIFHWRKDRFVTLKGQSDILISTLRETLKRREVFPGKKGVHLKEFGKTFYVTV